MNIALDADRTVITRLRLRGRIADPLLMRLRASSALGSATLAPPGLPPAAILVVCRMEDPLPGKLAFRSAMMRVPAEWEQAARARMAALSSRALRPARDAVPETAEAVLFADYSELLACLARDWLRGEAAMWWWQALFPDRDLATAVVRAWRDRPDCIPAAIAQLARRRDDVAFVSRLEEPVVRGLLQAVLVSHALPGLVAALAPLLDPAARSHENPGGAERDLQRISSPGSEHPERVCAPWASRLADGAASALSPIRETFVGLCLSLSDAPHALRARMVAEQVRRWAEDRSHERRPGEHSVRPEAEAAGPSAPSGGDRARPAVLASGHPSESGMMPPQPFAGAHSAGPAPQLTDTASMRAGSLPDSWRPVAPQTMPGEPGQAAGRPAKPEPVEDGRQADCVETRYGGVFLLINLGLFLELYGDFTNPRRPGLELSIWDFIALVGERIAGRAIRRDPLWPLLTHLAGRRTAEPQSAGFEPPSEWRIPPLWLIPFNRDKPWRAIHDGRRLKILHPLGFAVVDVPADRDDPKAQLDHELSSYQVGSDPFPCPPLVRRKVREGVRSADPLARWLGWLIPYLRARLARALGVPSARKAGHLLCRHHARVVVTPVHLDVTFSLAAWPIEIRLSGLDRDPGWVPAGGRMVRFHYD